MSRRYRHTAVITALAITSIVRAQDDAHVERGALDADDQTLESGEYTDHHTFFGHVGQRVTVDLRSTDFDPYLIVVAPDDAQVENDDYEGDRTRARVSIDIETAGTYNVFATSYEVGEVGSYDLSIVVDEGAEPLGSREERGTLTADDETLSTGEHFDAYEFAGVRGQHVRFDLRSNDFDTYLMVVPPKGEQIENDDAESTSHSTIDADLTVGGTYRVIVTSYETGELGDYLLTITETERSNVEPEDVVPVVALGDRVEGRLEAGDDLLSDGEYSDTFEFDGRAGDAVRIELASKEFDTYLALLPPSGDAIQNDDYEGDTRRSVIELSLAETGRYRIIATTYESGEIGAYALTLSKADSSAMTLASESRGRIFGLFAGIGDYPGKDNDLLFTAEDALRLRDALISGSGMRESDQITLLDGQVTRAALSAAMRDLGHRARSEDTFVFFFSGHGNRVARAAGPQAADPDALDETLELHDGSMTDDELRELFDDVGARTSLIFIDACFSGGFAKDLISVPGRMGLFSSEEDVTSSVAAKFQAGGYLSLFLADAIADKLADADHDGGVSAIELSQYVYDRYRADVKTTADDFVRSSGPRTGHQHLVVDRGSIGPYDVLFR